MLQTKEQGQKELGRCLTVAAEYGPVKVAADLLYFSQITACFDELWPAKTQMSFWPRGYKTCFMLNSAEHKIKLLTNTK